MAKSCSHWWHAPVYFTISVILAFIAISTAFRSNPNTNDSISTTKPMSISLSLNASQTLRKSGFNTIATLLQISPELFLSSSEATIFAIKDSAISNITLPPLLMKQLLQYHTIPFKVSMEDLLKKAPRTCLQTLLLHKNLSITRTRVKNQSVEINHVSISDPDLFVGPTISIHGVLGSFSPLKSDLDLDFIKSPICDSNSSNVAVESKNMIEWNRIVRLLSSKGFVSFSIGLHSVLDSILRDTKNLSSVTIFAPPDLIFLTSPSPLLERTVRIHILSRRYTYTELASFPKNSLLPTLVPNCNLEVTGNVSLSGRVIVNGVEITSPEIFTAKGFTVHGISRAFKTKEISSTS